MLEFPHMEILMELQLLISSPAGCIAYRITEAPAIDLVSVNGDGSFIYASTSEDHGFSAGDAVIIFDTGNPAVEGSYEVIADGLTGTTFLLVSTFSGSVAGGKVREAAGYFEPQTYTPEPRVYVVDDATVIGGKVIPGVNVGIGEVRYDESYTSGTYYCCFSKNFFLRNHFIRWWRRWWWFRRKWWHWWQHKHFFIC